MIMDIEQINWEEMEGKRIVIIDNFEANLESMTEVLKEKGFEAYPFKSLDEAKPFIEKEKPDLIISDLITHNDLAGAEYVIDQLTKKKIRFAFWMDEASGNAKDNEFGIFFQGLPKNYRVSYDPSTALPQQKIDILVEDYHSKKSSTFNLFSKKGGLMKILEYFKLKS